MSEVEKFSDIHVLETSDNLQGTSHSRAEILSKYSTHILTITQSRPILSNLQPTKTRPLLNFNLFIKLFSKHIQLLFTAVEVNLFVPFSLFSFLCRILGHIETKEKIVTKWVTSKSTNKGILHVDIKDSGMDKIMQKCFIDVLKQSYMCKCISHIY